MTAATLFVPTTAPTNQLVDPLVGPDKPTQLRSRSRPRLPFIKPAGPRRTRTREHDPPEPANDETRFAPCPLGFAAAPRRSTQPAAAAADLAEEAGIGHADLLGAGQLDL